MGQDETVHKVICYVGRDGLAILSCPDCKAARTIDTNKKDSRFKTFKAKCKCGASIRGRFEYRRYLRKKVRFSGFYKQKETGTRGYIIIENISMGGVGFRSITEHDIQRGDRLDITFTLDNPKKSKVTLRVEALHINDRFIGVKRLDIQSMQPELDFYLR